MSSISGVFRLLKQLFFSQKNRESGDSQMRVSNRLVLYQSRNFAASSNNFDASKISISLTKSPKPKPAKETLLFGKTFSDHMLECDWDEKSKWGPMRISPYHNFEMSPATNCLHYGLTIFEGLKAYKVKDRVMLFRPDKNMERMIASAKRMALPEIDIKNGVEAVKALVDIDRDWIPEGDGYSLYIRPQLIATEPFIGVHPTSNAKFYIITGPVGAYYKTGFKAVRLYADVDHIRAWPGGTGAAKCGGNYAAGMAPQITAAQQYDCQQVLWLFGKEHHITEAGTMNCFIFWKNEKGEKELVTAPLSDGTILPGVTRDSILVLARQWGEFKVTERFVGMPELERASKEGRLYEAFGAGTAAVVSPIKTIVYSGREVNVPLDPQNPQSQTGPLALRFYKAITDIQYGKVPHEWCVDVPRKNK